ncbi:MAG: hypothetical protein HC903_08330 [Methylacidiphilales bacterium]|nr:hypothetical protein [Candidatus Methylacidiphilales bacterium]NJR15724.1 hypothetical protein [Calothrix sp. CSU_2_0]
MAEPTLVQVFGTNASQTATELIIKKSDLAAIGLVPTANNTAESLLVALILTAGTYLTSTNQETNVDIQVTVEKGLDSFTTRNNQNYRQYSYTVDMQKLDPSTVSAADF